jgi:phage-related protein
VSASSKPPLKPLKWVAGSKKSLDGLPEDVKDVFGSALLDVQYGETPDGAKPFGRGCRMKFGRSLTTMTAIRTARSPQRLFLT